MRLRSLSAAVLALSFCACLPNPQSVKERREQFPRESMMGDLILSELPSDAKPVEAIFGERIELVAYRLDETPTPGSWVHVTFYWRANKPVDEDYQVFVHGDALEGNARRIHGDHFPAKGKYPTDVWQDGEIVADPFKVFVPPGYGPKRLGLYTGMYKDNYRVPLSSEGKRPSGRDNRSLAVEINF